MAETITQVIQLRRGYKTTPIEGLNQIPDSYILEQGEPCFEADTLKLKIGDGSTQYKDLPYIGDGGSTIVDVDNKSIVVIDGKVALKGFENATSGQILTKGADGNNQWIDVNYYTKQESDNRYYTKTDADNKFATKLYVDDTFATKSELTAGLATKQDFLTAGDNITIAGNRISAKDTTYTAGSGIKIENNVISLEADPGREVYADSVKFRTDLQTHYTIGKYTASLESPATIPVRDLSIVQAWNKIFLDERQPNVVEPSWDPSGVNISGISSKSTTEDLLHAKVPMELLMNFSKGSYQYGPADTGVSCTSVTFNGCEATKISDTQYKLKFDEFLLDTGIVTKTITFNYVLSVLEGDEYWPLTNLGNKADADKKIKSGEYPATRTVQVKGSGVLSVTLPTVTSSIGSASSAEVGSTVTVPYTIEVKNAAGGYPYGHTKGSASSSDAGLTQNVVYKMVDDVRIDNISSGYFATDTITEETHTHKFSVYYSYNDSPYSPVTQYGNVIDVAKIPGSSITVAEKSMTVPVGYRKWFYTWRSGTDEQIDPAALTSEIIRDVTKFTGSTGIPSTLSTNKMKQIFIIIPQSAGVTSVVINNESSHTPTTPIKHPNPVNVEGANNYTAIAYDIWYLQNAVADNNPNIYSITLIRG